MDPQKAGYKNPPNIVGAKHEDLNNQTIDQINNPVVMNKNILHAANSVFWLSING